MHANTENSINAVPRVSVTVVTYNHGDWLAQCLESIVTQKTNFSFEVIVGDDASTDQRTTEVLHEYASKYPKLIVPIVREINIGPTANYLDVIQRTKGEYIAHIDGDDVAKPGKLQMQYDFLQKHRDCVMVGHQCDVVDGDGKFLRLFSKNNTKRVFDIDYLLKRHAVFPHSSIMYRAITKSELRYVGKNILDIYLYLCIARYGNIGYISRSLGIYRRGVGIASKGYPESLQEDVIEKAALSGASRQAINAYKGKLNLHMAYISYKSGEMRSYFKFSFHAFKLDPTNVDCIKMLAHSILKISLYTLKNIKF